MEQTSEVQISVIMPVYNARDYVESDGKSRNKYKSAKMQWKVYRFIGKNRLNALRYMVHYTLNSVKKYTRG